MASDLKTFEPTLYEDIPKISLYRRNEVKIEAISLLYKGVELGYERILNDDISVGATALVLSYERVVDDKDLNFHFSPYARYYLSSKPASGLFLDVFASVFSRNYLQNPDTMTYTSEVSTAFGFNFGLKWVKRSGFNLELAFGIGREPRSLDSDKEVFIPKRGFYIGYRF